ncbi:sulfatase-like hydrolase/transferase [Pseudoalteromonas sp. P1-7a]|uniref:sulfatase-like hydrolase/transferase n=1 Tax=Pseudoalteromonas sp. P1-7a TaxID=1723755 RepID=UPI0006E4D0A6|nr:sulfatase-like hydrolase/transferase [Pseudoalteromonas sp. P1-7a]KPZ53242.1 Sulfatase [Pseudoalteromonas sp. P1-7a]
MLKNILVSFCIFLLFVYFWFINIPSFNFKGANVGSKLEVGLYNYQFLAEATFFLIGIILSVILFALLNHVLSTNLKSLSKQALSKSVCLFISWALSLSLLLGITSYLYPELFFSHEAWKSKIFLLSCSFIVIIILVASFWLKENRLNITVLFIPFIIPNLTPDFRLSGTSEQARANKNVFIIGIDSLNTSVISKRHTPFIFNFIDSGVHLPNSYTHIARTFPSWMTILTGNYPITNKARFNLTDFGILDTKKSLPYYLKKAGYYNYFSLDERRFSHIDHRLFFDKTIGPPATIGEFVFSKLLDIPLLVVTSDLTFFNFLMPQIHNNRAAWQTYSPLKYNKKLKRSIELNNSPIFVASHFTLPHWPYKSSHNTTNEKGLYEKYLESVESADSQIENYFHFLRHNGLLDNSIVFILSDHGESFARDEDMPDNSEEIVNLAGHGTSIVSQQQFNVLISFKEYINGKEVKHESINKSFRYALSDITPTILDILGLESQAAFDGKSIFKVKTERPLPIESSLKPTFNKSGNISVSGTVAQNANLFEISDMGQLIIKTELLPILIKEKQRGVIYGKWQLSIYPELNDATFITNLETNTLFNSEMFDEPALKQLLLSKLCELYSPEVKQTHIRPCFNNLNFMEIK